MIKISYDPLPEYRSKTRTGFIQKKLSGVLGEGSLRVPRTATKKRVVSSTSNRFVNGDLSHKLPDQKMFSKESAMNEFQQEVYNEAFEDELQKIAAAKIPISKVKDLGKKILESYKYTGKTIKHSLGARKANIAAKKMSSKSSKIIDDAMNLPIGKRRGMLNAAIAKDKEAARLKNIARTKNKLAIRALLRTKPAAITTGVGMAGVYAGTYKQKNNK